MTSATAFEPAATEPAAAEPDAAPRKPTRGVREDVAPPSPGERIRASLQRLAVAAIDKAAGAAVDKVDDLSERLEEVTANGGVGLGAAFGAGNAMMAGKNPVWGAVKGAWGALSTGKKVAIVVGLVLLGLLGPVALIVALVVLLVVAIVKAVKS